MEIKRGDVVWAKIFKYNPVALWLCVRAVFTKAKNYTVCPISSSDKHFNLVRVYVAPGVSGLEVRSVMERNQLQTLPAARLGKVVGRLAVAEMETIDRGLRLWLEL